MLGESEEKKVEQSENEDLEGFGYIEFYKKQMEELKIENDSLKEKVLLTEKKMKRVKEDCMIMVQKLCRDIGTLRQKIKSLSLDHKRCNIILFFINNIIFSIIFLLLFEISFLIIYDINFSNLKK